MEWNNGVLIFQDWMIEEYNKLPISCFSPSAGLIIADGKIVGLQFESEE